MKLVYHMKRAYGHTERRENGLKVGKWPRNSEWIALLLLACFRCGYSYEFIQHNFRVVCEM
jgi:hypothetical protein